MGVTIGQAGQSRLAVAVACLKSARNRQTLQMAGMAEQA